MKETWLNRCCISGKISDIDFNFLQQYNLSVAKELFFGSEKLGSDKNKSLLVCIPDFVQSMERSPPFQKCNF